MVFDVESNKSPKPIIIRKMLLVLIAANILSHNATVIISTEENGKVVYITIKTVLGYSRRQNTSSMPIYVMFDDTYWHRIKVII